MGIGGWYMGKIAGSADAVEDCAVFGINHVFVAVHHVRISGDVPRQTLAVGTVALVENDEYAPQLFAADVLFGVVSKGFEAHCFAQIGADERLCGGV